MDLSDLSLQERIALQRNARLNGGTQAAQLRAATEQALARQTEETFALATSRLAHNQHPFQGFMISPEQADQLSAIATRAQNGEPNEQGLSGLAWLKAAAAEIKTPHSPARVRTAEPQFAPPAQPSRAAAPAASRTVAAKSIAPKPEPKAPRAPRTAPKSQANHKASVSIHRHEGQPATNLLQEVWTGFLKKHDINSVGLASAWAQSVHTYNAADITRSAISGVHFRLREGNMKSDMWQTIIAPNSHFFDRLALQGATISAEEKTTVVEAIKAACAEYEARASSKGRSR